MFAPEFGERLMFVAGGVLALLVLVVVFDFLNGPPAGRPQER